MEIFGGIWGLFSWATLFQTNVSLVQVFMFTSRFHILVEIANLFLVYSAEDTWSNNQNGASNFAFIVHSFGLVMSLMWLISVNTYNGALISV